MGFGYTSKGTCTGTFTGTARGGTAKCICSGKARGGETIGTCTGTARGLNALCGTGRGGTDNKISGVTKDTTKRYSTRWYSKGFNKS